MKHGRHDGDFEGGALGGEDDIVFSDSVFFLQGNTGGLHLLRIFKQNLSVLQIADVKQVPGRAARL